MIRRPPRSTLFPLHDALPISWRDRRSEHPLQGAVASERSRHVPATDRSEEHTSELQSQSNLVCRLLLEKKKKKKKQHITLNKINPIITQASIYLLVNNLLITS